MTFANSGDFIQKYFDYFGKMQGKLLDLYNSEINFHDNQHFSEVNPSHIKDLVNKDIISNMVEVMIIQSVLSMNLKMTKLLHNNLDAKALKLKDAPPISLKIFKNVLPESYISEVQKQLGKT